MFKIIQIVTLALIFNNTTAYAQKDITEVINSVNDEYGLAFITENLVCFTRNEGRKKLMLTKRVNGKWQTPEVAPFSGTWRDEYPTYDKAANKLYFASKRPFTSNSNIQSKNDIWYVDYKNGTFGKSKHLGQGFSTAGIDSGGFGNGETLYFHSDRSGSGMNDVDIYQGNLKNGKIKKLPFNSSEVDGEPFVFNNGKSILFMSTGHGSLGKSDIFITQIKNGVWTKPLPVDDKGLVNTSAWEYAPTLSLDEETLYYTRIRNGNADIIAIPVEKLSNGSLINNAFEKKAATNNVNNEVDRLILPLVETNNYSGSVLISKNNKKIVQKNYGFSDLTNNIQVSNDTKFFLASVSMPFTSLAIMKLVDDGKIKLTDKVSQYVSDYRHGEKITIHHLLAQRSGIPAIGTEDNVDYNTMSLSKQSIENLYNYFKDYKLLFEPGSKYNHGRSDYILLAKIIEKLSGKTFGNYLKEILFKPLQMYNTGHFNGYEDIVTNLAKGYAPVGLYEVENAFPLDWSAKTGHASIYSTAEDLQKFGQAIIEGKILTKKSWNKIFTDYGNSIGYGWFVRDHGKHKRVQMNGRSPGFSSYFALYPEDNMVVVMLSNKYVSLPVDMGIPLASIVFNEHYNTLKLSTKRLTETHAKNYLGTYLFDENFYRPNFKMTITYKDGYLYSDWGGLIPLNPDKNSFKTFILRTYWLNVQFHNDTSEKIKEINIDGQHIGKKITEH